ncbi:MAG: SH3 domain-containing protein [Clostridia bacterium]|nr:SH3 domain-containing protein [Clostridia bacterium]
MKSKVLLASLCLLVGMQAMGCAADKKGWEETPPSGEIVLPQEPELPQEEETPDVPVEPDIPAAPDAPPLVPIQPGTPVETPDTLISSTVNALQVRSGAGTKYAAVGSLDKSDMVMPLRKVGEWYEVYYKNSLGYVSGSYVRSVPFAKGGSIVERIIDEGKKQLGMPYVYGAPRYHWGNGKPNADFTGQSFDCSSYMQYIFKRGANVNLAMTSREQSLQGVYVARKDIRRGDLLFFTNATRYDKTGVERIGHVALYLGDNIILHTASDHAVIEPISAQRSAYYITARRLVD